MTSNYVVPSGGKPALALKPARSETIGGRIRAARLNLGMSGATLGAKVGLKKDQISKIETDTRKANAGELLLIAEALGTNADLLLGRNKRKRLQIAHRLAPGAQTLDGAVARNRARQLIEIEDLLVRTSDGGVSNLSEEGSRATAKISQFLSTVPTTDAEARGQGQLGAEIVREILDLGTTGLTNLPELFERHFGAHVELSPLGEKVDGICVHSDDFALIMASTDFSQGHTNFTLAHELAHHIFHDPREIIAENSSDMFSDDIFEKRANAFAAYFLMPVEGLTALLGYHGEAVGTLTGRTAIRLMETFGVSLMALNYHLDTIGWMSYESSRSLREYGVGNLVHKYSGDAPNGAWATPSRSRRHPARLVSAATDAVRAERLGLGPLAALLEREDNEELWEEIMSDSTAG